MSKFANTAIKNFLTDQFAAQFNSGTLNIYTGAQPANGDTAASGTLLVSITLPATAFSASAAGTAATSGTWQGTAVASGTAGWFRMSNTGGTRNIDGNVTASGGGGDMTLDNISINTGQVVTINTFNLTALSGA